MTDAHRLDVRGDKFLSAFLVEPLSFLRRSGTIYTVERFDHVSLDTGYPQIFAAKLALHPD